MGLAHPPPITQDELWETYFRAHLGRSGLARRLWRQAGVVTRHGVIHPAAEDVASWSTGRRMQRYAAEAPPLGKAAVAAALDDAGLSTADIGLLTVASCTGYTAPGPDILLARDLDLAPDTRRLFIGHMGCYAALPALGAAADFVSAHNRPAVLLCLELTSLHVQPPTTDPGQVVVHSLFSDAAAAIVLAPTPPPATASGPTSRPTPVPTHALAPASRLSPGSASRWGGSNVEFVDVVAHTDPATASYMTWEVTDLGFRMGLSPRVPDVLATQVGDVVTAMLSRHGLTPSEVDGWAVHPGGPRILDVVAASLDLPPDSLAESRDVLRDHGNCSSATVLLVLDRILATPRRGPIVALAFGPGLTLYAALLLAS